MPDNLPQDWTDDAAFWDEAWADMSARLEQTERKHTFTRWRGWGLAILLLLPLLFYLNAKLLTPAVPVPSDTSATPEAIASTTPPEEPNNVLLPNDKITMDTDAAESENNLGNVPAVRTTGAKNGLPTSVPTTTVTTNKVSSPNTNTITEEGGTEAPIINSSPIPATPVSEAIPEPPPVTANRGVLPAAPSLETRNTQLLTWSPARPTPKLAAFKKTTQRSALAVEGGVNTGGVPDFGGQFIGLRYAVPLSRKLSLPVGLRHQHHNWRIASLEDRPEFERVADPSTPNMDGTSFLNNLSAEALDRVITRQITLRTGLEYRAGKRWTLFGGTGIHYFLSGRGPSVDDDGARLVSLNFNRWGGTREDALAVTGGSTGDTASPATANSLGLSLYGGAGYRIGNRWTVFGELSVLTTPIYRGQPATVQRSRLGVGFRYRIK